MNLTEELFIIACEKCPFNSIESHDYRQLETMQQAQESSIL